MSTVYDRPLHTKFQRVPPSATFPNSRESYYVMIAGCIVVSADEVRAITSDKLLWAVKEEKKQQFLSTVEALIDDHTALDLVELQLRLNHNERPRDAQPSREDGVRSATRDFQGNAEPGVKPGSQRAEAGREVSRESASDPEGSTKDGATQRATSRDKSTYERLRERYNYAAVHAHDEVRLTIEELREVLDFILYSKSDLDAAEIAIGGGGSSQGNSAGAHGASSAYTPPVAETPIAADATSPAQRREVLLLFCNVCQEVRATKRDEEGSISSPCLHNDFSVGVVDVRLLLNG